MLALALAAFGPGGVAQAQASAETRPEPMLIGTVTGDPEKDSLGYPTSFQGSSTLQGCGSGAPRYSTEMRHVGPVLGDPEKDSIGFIVLHDAGACASPANPTPR